MYKNIHSSTIHNDFKGETVQMIINFRIDKLWYIHTILYYMAMRINDFQ